MIDKTLKTKTVFKGFNGEMAMEHVMKALSVIDPKNDFEYDVIIKVISKPKCDTKALFSLRIYFS